MATSTAAPHTTCSLCAGLAGEERAFQTYGWEEDDTYLPAAAGRLTVVRDFKPYATGSRSFKTFEETSKEEYGNEIPLALELVPLAVPRRVYTQSHFDYLVDVIDAVWTNRFAVSGYKITKEPPSLRHFTCHFEAVETVQRVIPLRIRKTGS